MRLFVTTAAVAAALALSACAALTPHKVDRQLSQVAVSFDPTVLGSLASEMKTLQVRIYGVNGDVLGAQEGTDQSFPIVQQQKEYDITGVHLGMKEFEVTILDAQSNALGVGRMRWLVTPGLNKTDALVIKIKSAQQQVATIALDLAFTADGGVDPTASIKKVVIQWKTQNSAQSGEIELTKSGAVAPSLMAFTDVQSIFVGAGSCSKSHCHAAASPAAGLDLSSYPFKSSDSQEERMKTIIERMNDADSPMPPSGLLDAALLAKVNKWQTDGFLAVAPPATGAADNDFRAKIENLKLADKLLCTLIVTGENGVELYHKDLDPYALTEQDDTLKLSVKLNVAAPTVAIPIVVEPQG